MLKRCVILSVFLTFSLSCAFAQVSLQNLRCELLQEPVGIDVLKPGLSWEIHSAQHDVKQTAYHILVASSIDKLTEKDADVWNSGLVNSSMSLYNTYTGQALK